MEGNRALAEDKGVEIRSLATGLCGNTTGFPEKETREKGKR